MCSSAFENVPYSLENYTVKSEQFDQLKKNTSKNTSIGNHLKKFFYLIYSNIIIY